MDGIQIGSVIDDLTKDRLLTASASEFMRRLSTDLSFALFVALQIDQVTTMPAESSGAQELRVVPGNIHQHAAAMWEMFYCRCVDNFLTYVTDLLREILKVQPSILASTEKITTERILKARSLEELVEDIVDEHVASLSHRGFKELCEWFAKRGLKFCPRDEDMKEMSQAIAIRNLVVHNRGRVDARFLRVAPQVAKEKRARIEIDVLKTMSMIRTVGITVSYVDIVAAKKFKLETSRFVTGL